VPLAQAEGFLDGELVEGVEGLLEAGEGEGWGRDAWFELAEVSLVEGREAGARTA
jgi:hypothetical protein